VQRRDADARELLPREPPRPRRQADAAHALTLFAAAAFQRHAGDADGAGEARRQVRYVLQRRRAADAPLMPFAKNRQIYFHAARYGTLMTAGDAAHATAEAPLPRVTARDRAARAPDEGSA